MRVTLRDRQLRERVPPRPPSKRLTTSIDRVGHGHSLVHSAFCSPDGATRAWQRGIDSDHAGDDTVVAVASPGEPGTAPCRLPSRSVGGGSSGARHLWVHPDRRLHATPDVETDTSSCRPACQHFPVTPALTAFDTGAPIGTAARLSTRPGGTTAWPVGSRQSASPARMFRDRHPDGKPQPLIHGDRSHRRNAASSSSILRGIGTWSRRGAIFAST